MAKGRVENLKHALPGENNYFWKGGVTSDGYGYTLIYNPGHPSCDKRGYVREHILVVEKVLGRFLKRPEEPHHLNGMKSDNNPGNFVLCPDRAYHMLLHQRMRALAACGNANYVRCAYGKDYDDPQNMFRNTQGRYYHKSCHNSYCRAKYAKAAEIGNE